MVYSDLGPIERKDTVSANEQQLCKVLKHLVQMIEPEQAEDSSMQRMLEDAISNAWQAIKATEEN